MLSARNNVKGEVCEVKKGAVSGLVKIKSGNECITANISLESIEKLGLEQGKTATAVIKATEVMIATEKAKLSVRNQIPGKITEVKKGAVNGIVKVDADCGAKFTSTISIDSIEDLGLEVGKSVYVVIKATSVMVMVD